MSPLMRKALLIILIPLIILSLIASFVTIYSINKYLIDKTFKDLLDEAHHSSAILEKKFSEIESALSVLSYTIGNQFDYEEYRQKGDLYLKDFRDDIAGGLLKSAENISAGKGIYFMFSPGLGSRPSQVWFHQMPGLKKFERIVEYPSPEDFDITDPDMQYYFYPLENQKSYWSEPYTDKDTGEQMVSFTIPVWDRSRIIGIAGFDLSLITIEKNVSELVFLEKGYAFLLSSQSKIIFHPQFTFDTPIQSALGDGLDFLSQELMSNKSENTAVYYFQGEKKRLGYKRLNNGWLLGITAFESDVFKPMKLIHNILIGSSALILLMTVLIGYFAARFISLPIIQLTEEVKKSTTDFESTISEPLLLGRKDEIGNLSRQFKQMQRAFKKTLEQIIKNNVSLERSALLGNQVASFTHELKTPIGVVLTALTFSEDCLKELFQKIESGKLKKSEMIEALEKVREGTRLSIRNIEQTTKTISSFKNIAVSQSDIRMEKIDFNKLIEDISRSISITYKKKNIIIEKNIPLGITLESFSGYITQVFTNLFQNSIQHGFLGRDSGKITIDCFVENEIIKINYSDNGSGIPEEHADKIFNPYFSSAKERGGSGLGMHIIHTIIHKYLKGTIEYDNSKKPGVLFRITLPRV